MAEQSSEKTKKTKQNCHPTCVCGTLIPLYIMGGRLSCPLADSVRH